MDSLDVRFFSHLKLEVARRQFVRVWNRKLLKKKVSSFNFSITWLD